MATLGEQFSRRRFEDATDSDALAQSLSDVLTARLRTAAEAPSEATALVAELKALGHELFSWDESLDFQTWGDDYTRPKRRRIIIDLRYPEDEEPWAEVHFGPWPPAVPAPACVRCARPMTPSHLRIRGIGHGHVGSRDVTVEILVGEQDKRTLTVGQASRGYAVAAFWCPFCAALWLPDTASGGWTG
jgi:hypothetical protein